MDDKGLILLTIESAKERCEALSGQVERLAEKQYPSSGSQILISLVKKINQTLCSKLEEIEDDEEIYSLLTPQQVQQRVNRYSQLIPYLHDLLSFLDGAEIKETPAALAPALRRILQYYLPEAELILASKPELNYSFLEIAKQTKSVFSSAGLEALVEDFPDTFVVITSPTVEVGNVLLHCVIAHEIGHGLYQRNNLSDKLLPSVEIKEDEIARFASLIFKAEHEEANKQGGVHQLSLFPSELEIKARITELINSTVENWLEELTSDAIGLALFGPAYFYSIIYLVLSFQLLDNCSDSHPPNNLRIRLMLLMLGALDETESSLGLWASLPAAHIAFIEGWKSAINSVGKERDIYRIAVQSILKVLPTIGELAKDILGNKRFEGSQCKTIESLSGLIINGLPPNELLDFCSKTFYHPGVILILNAGWDVMIAHMNEFSEFFGRTYKDEKAFCKSKLSELITKAIELDNVRILWNS